MAIVPRAAYSAESNAVASVVVQADDLIVVIYSFGVNATPTCSDNANGGTNTYTQAGISQGTADGTACTVISFWAKAKASETLTITCTSETAPVIAVHVYSGANITAPVDGFTAKTDSSDTTSHTSGTDNTGNANDVLVCGWYQINTAETPTTSGGWTRRTLQNSGYGETACSCDYIVSSTGAYSCPLNGTYSVEYVSLIVGFKALDGGGRYTVPGLNVPVFNKQGET